MSDERKTVLITGASGMIGSNAVKGMLDAGYKVIGVDVKGGVVSSDNYVHHSIDLFDKRALADIVSGGKIDRIIHLAALAHSVDGKEYSWEDYERLNVTCAKNVFETAGTIPLLFISTVDVFGFTKGTVNVLDELHPVSNYAKSKAQAEEECKKAPIYTIFRFSPVYTDTVKRDVQKRYYLKYPKLAYMIGKGSEYEVLNVNNAVSAMVEWCSEEPQNDIRIIKDSEPMKTTECIKSEKQAGRARFVLRLPRWIVSAGYYVLKTLTGENKYTYLLNKAVFPLKTE